MREGKPKTPAEDDARGVEVKASKMPGVGFGEKARTFGVRALCWSGAVVAFANALSAWQRSGRPG
jgi:hypothetical protein